MILRTERECRSDARFVVCKGMEEMLSAYNAGLLWVLCGSENDPNNWAWLHQSTFSDLRHYCGRWPDEDFAVLVEQEDE